MFSVIFIIFGFANNCIISGDISLAARSVPPLVPRWKLWKKRVDTCDWVEDADLSAFANELRRASPEPLSGGLGIEKIVLNHAPPYVAL